jgi:hypothetical protein
VDKVAQQARNIGLIFHGRKDADLSDKQQCDAVGGSKTQQLTTIKQTDINET